VVILRRAIELCSAIDDGSRSSLQVVAAKSALQAGLGLSVDSPSDLAVRRSLRDEARAWLQCRREWLAARNGSSLEAELSL
jgi:hypothetical protein